MRVGSRNHFNVVFLTHLYNIFVKFVLLGNIVPLEFTIPSVAEDLHHSLCSGSHGVEDSLGPFLPVLPVAAGVNASKTRRGRNNALAILLQ